MNKSKSQSKYHKDCTTQDNKIISKKKSQALPEVGKITPLGSKPFCDCKDCTSPDCPDILQRLAITVTEKTCIFGVKAPTKIAKDNCPVCEQFTSQKSCPKDGFPPDNQTNACKEKS